MEVDTKTLLGFSVVKIRLLLYKIVTLATYWSWKNFEGEGMGTRWCGYRFCGEIVVINRVVVIFKDPQLYVDKCGYISRIVVI